MSPDSEDLPPEDESLEGDLPFDDPLEPELNASDPVTNSEETSPAPELVEGPRDPELVEGPRDPELVEGPRDPELVEGPRDPELVEGEPIPKILHSFYEDRPFVSCTRCGESLAEFEDGYRISKNFNGDECIIEYALCLPCLDAMLDEASEESKIALAKFQAENLREVSGFEECALCDKTFDQVKDRDYSFAGVCQGDKMFDSAMVCFDCMEAMAEVMSEETRKTWDRFREENFPGVPSDFEPFPNQGAPIVF